MAAGPTQRTLKRCRKLGWIPAVVERRLPRGFTTIDLYGGIDLVVMDNRPGLLGIQCTSGDHVAHRCAKLDELPAMVEWLKRGLRLEVWGWRKLGKAGQRKLWNVRRTRAELDGDGVNALGIKWTLVEEDT